MDARATFRTLARYNRWMNERLYAACASMPDELRKRDRRAYFRTIHGTLNHLLLGDRPWLDQTHHRGQLTTLLSQCGVDPGLTDLIWLPGEAWSREP